ncbi:branched-chain amino acid ABC transporter ATP-binding protein/permease [Eoetvoesiella caeni]
MSGYKTPNFWFAVFIILMVVVAPYWVNTFTVSLLNDIGVASLVALGLILITGVGGITSFGQAAFVGIAAYATAWLSTSLGWSPWLGLLAALLITCLSAYIIGLLTLNLGGHFLPLSTIAWGFAIPLLFGNIDALGRHSGLSDIPPITFFDFALLEPRSIYYLVWGCVGLVFWFSYNLLASRQGRAIRSLRGGSVLLASVGADAFRVRLTLFIVAALFAGLSGWIYAHMNRFVSPAPFGLAISIEYLLMAVAGGVSHLVGALVGSAVMLNLKDALKDFLPLLTQRSNEIEALVFAGTFILLLHFARGGIMGFVVRWTNRFTRPRPPSYAQRPIEPLPQRSLPEKGTAILSVSGAVKRFGGLVAVNDVSFNVFSGEIVGLIGPNGAGKSTMFNLVASTFPMSAGAIHFMGRDTTQMAQRDVARLGLARTFQHVKLRPNMTLLDNVALGAYSRTTAGFFRSGFRLDRKDERRVMQESHRQLDRIGLGDQALSLAGSLPLGTQRILEIARALASDPALLILDEPAAGLRSKEKERLGQLLKQLRDEGVTILIVEHDMDFVMKLVDRVVVMNFGSKLVEGTPSEVRADERVQAAYLGSVT